MVGLQTAPTAGVLDLLGWAKGNPFLAHLPAGVPTSLARVASSVYGILAATHTAGSREIALIPAQDLVASPPTEFAVERLR